MMFASSSSLISWTGCREWTEVQSYQIKRSLQDENPFFDIPERYTIRIESKVVYLGRKKTYSNCCNAFLSREATLSLDLNILNFQSW
jgi:hypothetical protein